MILDASWTKNDVGGTRNPPPKKTMSKGPKLAKIDVRLAENNLSKTEKKRCRKDKKRAKKHVGSTTLELTTMSENLNSI